METMTHLWLLSIWNVATDTKVVIFKFYLALIN